MTQKLPVLTPWPVSWDEKSPGGDEEIPCRDEEAPDGDEALGAGRPGVLPRAVAVAAAHEAVRRSRERLAAERDIGSAQPVRIVREAAKSSLPRAARTAGSGAGEDGRRSAPGVAGERGEEARLPPRTPPLRRRAVSALRDRLPVWVQLRCGVEPRTLLALAVVFLVAVGFAVHHFWAARPQQVRAPEAASGPPAGAGHRTGAGWNEEKTGRFRTGASAPGAAQAGRLVVDVTGKVRKPGIYRLPQGSRVADALESAGGPRPGTDLSALNRARRLVDGEQIVAGGPPPAGGAGSGTPAGTGPADGTGTSDAASSRSGSGSSGTEKGAGAGTGSGAGGSSGTPVSLSSATEEQLQTLPGVGPVLARHIVEYRNQHGGFTSVGQLRDVNGIGERRFADLKPAVSP